MILKPLYLALSVLGTVLPLAQVWPFLRAHGLDLPLFVEQLLSTPVSSFFAMDVIVSSVVLWVFVFFEGRRVGVRHGWAPILASLVVGVSLGLPLFLYLREGALERRNRKNRYPIDRPIVTGGFVFLLTLLASAGGAHAQAAGCTYDSCALRLHSGHLVQGVEARRIKGPGFFSSSIPLFEQASDSVRTHYQSFRDARRTAGTLNLVALAAMTTGLLVLAHQSDDDVGLPFFYGGLALSFAGGFSLRKASNHLSQAVWWYNRDLPRSPP